jgi:glucose-6-phosphate-specific signal transduction histidine kinase
MSRSHSSILHFTLFTFIFYYIIVSYAFYFFCLSRYTRHKNKRHTSAAVLYFPFLFEISQCIGISQEINTRL